MDSLLRWGIENSGQNADESVARPRQELDPAIIDVILGKPESELMKEALAVATDEGKPEDERLAALDDFEMLVEQIDNANNITSMKMWNPLHTLLTSSLSSEEIKSNTLWIIGTAVQNNPAAQNACLGTVDAPLVTILNVLSSTSASGTRSKALYALSGLLKHNAQGVDSMEELKGWDVLKMALEDSDITIRRKTVFLLNTLLLPNTEDNVTTNGSPGTNAHTDGVNSNTAPVHPNSHAGMTVESTATSQITSEALQRHGILEVLVTALVNPLPHGDDGEHEGDVDFTEKTVRLFFTYMVSCSGQLSPSDKEKVRQWLQSHKYKGENWELDEEEMTLLIRKLL